MEEGKRGFQNIFHDRMNWSEVYTCTMYVPYSNTSLQKEDKTSIR